MTWDEHEEEYCKDIDFLPTEGEIYETHHSYKEAYHARDYYEQGYDEGNVSSLTVVRSKDKYYVVYINSNAAEIKFKSNKL